MLIIGVTGGIGSGKTAVTDRFKSHGITIVDADLASRVIVEPGRPALAEIEAHFGAKVIAQDKTLNRRALREIVFSAPDERKWLEQLTHPLISEEIHSQLQSSDSAYTILVSPLLLESAQHQMAQRILVVDVPVEIQIARTVDRDNTTEEGVRAIVKAQMDRKARLQKADDVITNDKSLSELYCRVDDLHDTYLTLANA